MWNKIVLNKILLVIGACLVMISCATQQPGASGLEIITKDETGNGQHVRLQKGQQLRVVLVENPTTGYTWNVTHVGNDFLRVTKEQYAPDNKKMVGAPGKAAFCFQAMATGETRLELAYFREWEGADTAEMTYELNITVVE